MKRFHEQGLTNFRVAVNLSPRQFRDPSLSSIVKSAIADAGIDARTLELEITEGVAMEDVAAPGKVVSCNLLADKQHEAPPLCGFTNIQGRNVNGYADECRDSVDQGTGRFIHMEQDKILRKPYAQNWSHIEDDAFAKRLVEAFKSVVPEEPP